MYQNLRCGYFYSWLALYIYIYIFDSWGRTNLNPGLSEILGGVSLVTRLWTFR